jgi:hypothetical protein
MVRLTPANLAGTYPPAGFVTLARKPKPRMTTTCTMCGSDCIQSRLIGRSSCCQPRKRETRNSFERRVVPSWRPHGDSNPGLESRWGLTTTYIDDERDMHVCVIGHRPRHSYSHSHLKVSIARRVFCDDASNET